MELLPKIVKAPTTVTLAPGQTFEKTFAVGQQVSARVISANNTTGNVTLTINNTKIRAQSDLLLTPGQSLTLTVIQTKKDILLQLSQQNTEEAVIQKNLRTSLPKQQNLEETLNNLARLALEGKKTNLSENTIQFIQRFIQQLPGVKQLTQANILKELIQRSGIFLENRLTKITTKINLTLDFKSFLLQLKSHLLDEQSKVSSQTRPSNLTGLIDILLKQVDAGISRTQLHQLNSLADQDNKLSWSMEIPIRLDEKLYAIHLQLQKEYSHEENAEPALTVNLTLKLASLGPVHARITLVGSQVTVAIWAEQNKTYQLACNHVDNLKLGLKHSKLQPENISIHLGQPPHKPILHNPQKSTLLDVKA